MHPVILKAFIATLAFGTIHAFPQPKVLIPRAVDDGTDNSELIAGLKTDPTAIKRFRRLLTNGGQELINDSDLAKATVFDFNKGGTPAPGGQGGSAMMSVIESFPILVDSGISMNVATLGPCGIFVPHVHPRANEYFVVVEGEVDFGYMLEVGLLAQGAPNPEISGKLTKYTGTLFPQGSIHYQINNSPDCASTTILAALSSEDAGTTPVLLMPSGGNNMTVPRQVGGNDFDAIRPLLPQHIVTAVDQCLERCNAA